MTENKTRDLFGEVDFFHKIASVMVAAALLALTSCAAVGPDFTPPPPEAPAAWNTVLEAGMTADPADAEILAKWWTVFDDPVLSGLISQAAGGNLDLKQAESRIREARARRGVANAGFFPTLDTSGAYTRRYSSNTTNNFYRAGFDAGWEIDIFGGTRRAVEAADANLEASHENLKDVLVTLAAEVGLNYVETRTFQRQLAVANDNLRVQEETYDLIQFRYQAGLSDELALQQARYNFESTRAKIPNLRTGVAEAKNRLAVLTGKAPGGVDAILAEGRPIPVTPPTVAVGIPAETLKRRPDIRNAEKELAAQTALVGVATADLYPRLRLSGTIGLEAMESANFFKSASRFWNFGPGVSWNVFDAGDIRGSIEIQSAVQEQSLIAYEQTVLNALAEAENALIAYANEQLRRERLIDAVEAAQKAETLARDKYRSGLVNFTTVLDAQRSLFSFQEQLAISEGAVTSDLVQLYKALGGGWESAAPVK
ncbi:MAG: efflux transporter outer membrane subunit [Desulfobacteraceae bacterium]|jgi:multidrug efflux system outer membrane protein|nr:efflux transporter outer membrane subunit [Desulfobacteraceae bacterium]